MSERPTAPTAVDGMLRSPRIEPTGCTVAQALEILTDDHVHALLITDGDRLVSVIEREDLETAGREDLASVHGLLAERTVPPATELEPLRRQMVAEGRRRLAVVDGDRLLGLLCLKSSGTGFCTDEGVAARARERAQGAADADPEVS
ncbi:CBS domain-containing protein [Aeromicrobium sp. YIM 150415]|uniref:CBS domain-containing protein n=1 Tax=Aeromicrobium sp. YIM 150415 TaxID=2803912 RepID=UPI0019633724|nr:CBS domain-containing protein [Aeromicrobium sp. YIM 150415]MBM9463742.1 CBS domain-containing protein [Aeromicrobium sp. YIM 150415]